MAKKISGIRVGKTTAIFSAIVMFFLGVAGNMGVYTGAVNAMKQWHMFFDLSGIGIITGMIEAAVFGFFAGYVFIWLYNRTD